MSTPVEPQHQHVTVLERCQVSPSPAPMAGQPQTLPLTFFDLAFWGFPSVQRLFFYDHHHGEHDLLDVSGFLSRELPLFKQSLAAALHRFYPLAGKLACELQDEPEVVCSDGDSVCLTVAVAGDDFCDLAGDDPRDTARLRPLLPHLPEHGVFAVQVTVFPGAGVCIGTTLHHAVADGSSYAHFLRTWTAIHRRLGAEGDVNKTPLLDVTEPLPLFDRAVVRDDAGLREAFVRDHRALAATGDERLGNWDLSNRSEAVLLGTFRFTEEVLRGVGRRAEMETSARRGWRAEMETSARGCSPYAAACGAAWAGIAFARGNSGNGGQAHRFGFVTGCRARSSPPVPTNYFGNCLGLCAVEVEVDETTNLTEAAASAAIWRVIEGLTEQGRALRDARGWVRLVRESADARTVTVAGSPKLGIYAAADMGTPWGRPRKVEIISVERTGALALAEDIGGGIEVGVALPHGEMETFRAFYGDLVWRTILSGQGELLRQLRRGGGEGLLTRAQRGGRHQRRSGR